MSQILFTVCAIAVAAAVAVGPEPAIAQTYPTKPVRLIIPFPPGGSNDIVGRLVATHLSERLGKQVVVDNRTGAGGVVGTEAATRSPADGYTLLLVSAAHAGARAQPGPLIERPIPSTGERIPVIGIGTARRWEAVTTPAEMTPLRDVLRLFAEGGGKVIDTAPSYGTAEAVAGELVADLGIRASLFLATKVGVTGRQAGIEQIEASFRRLRKARIDLIAVHNLRDLATQLQTLRDLKQAGRIRYVGVTTSFARQYPDLERAMRAEPLDFVQVDYALDSRGAAATILPLAADRGMAVMINLPFGRGRLFQAVQGKPLPSWAGDFDCTSWAQFFLKYIVSHPAVICCVPGTAKVEYLLDNLGAARGRLPDTATRRRMEDFIDRL